MTPHTNRRNKMNNSFNSQIAQPSNQVGTTDDGQPIYEVELGEEVTKAQAKKTQRDT